MTSANASNFSVFSLAETSSIGRLTLLSNGSASLSGVASFFSPVNDALNETTSARTFSSETSFEYPYTTSLFLMSLTPTP